MTSISAVGGTSAPHSGLRPFDAGRDLAEVVSLLEIGFRGELESRDLQWLADLNRISEVAGPLTGIVLRLVPPMAANLKGFVWVEEGRVVSNASLFRGPESVWVVANVVTLPEFRRRGIAARLMEAAIRSARSECGREMQLQVRSDNMVAHQLYAGLGFERIFSTAWFDLPSWRSARRLPTSPTEAVARPMTGAEREAARRLLRRVDPSGGSLSPVLREAAYRSGLLAALEDRLLGRARAVVATREAGSLTGLAAAKEDPSGGAHQISLVVDPGWRGRVEAGLVNALLDAMARMLPLPLRAEIDTRETHARSALEGAGFSHRRTLDRMRLYLR